MKKALFLLSLLFATALFAADPGEDRVLAWVAAFNSGDAAAMEAFAAANYTPEQLARRKPVERKQMYEQLFGAHGKLRVQGVNADNDKLTVMTTAEKGEGLELRFVVEPQPPHRIAGLGIAIGGGGQEEGPKLPPLTLPKNATREQVDASLDAYLRKLTADDHFAGSVLVAKNGEVWFERSYGLASRRWDVPNKPSTRFNVGSITKDFTKAAIGQLAQAGKLKLDDLLIKHLPDYPNKEVAEKITIQQLLDHTSGLGDIFTPRFFETSKDRFETPVDFIEFFASDPLQFEPGKGRRYSNYGYTVLGAVIGRLSGENYFDYVARHIFAPAGMSGSGFFETRKPNKDLAVGHTRQTPNGRGQEWMENHSYSVRGIPAGGSYSSARDLFNFDRALRSGKLLNEEWTRWYFRGDPGQPGIYAGGSPGVNAVIASDKTWTVVVLVNVDPPVGENLGEDIFNRLKN